MVKVVDFGLAVDAKRMDRSVAGTLLRMAPDLFRSEQTSEQSDLCSVGVIAYQMFTGAYPFAIASGGAFLLQPLGGAGSIPALCCSRSADSPAKAACEKEPNRQRVLTLNPRARPSVGIASSSMWWNNRGP